MEITGNIKVIKDTQTIGNSGFKKRELVITTNEQYPQHLLIEFIQDKCELLNDFSINDDVEVSINLRGREWQSPTGEIKYFNTFHGWKINNANKELTPPHPPIELKNIEDDEIRPF